MKKKIIAHRAERKKQHAKVFLICMFILAVAGLAKIQFFNNLYPITPQKIITPPTPTPSPIPTPSATPTPRPLTFAQLNALYGPCAVVPILMYHHVQNLETASKDGHAGLTVDTEWFQKHMQYLKDHGYNPIRIEQLIGFFDSGITLPEKPVLLTFDDGYDDFATDAVPIMRTFGFPSVSFIPTGLIQNPGYMSWQTIEDIASQGLVYFANHTWSHHRMTSDYSLDQKEISTADTQLSQHGFNFSKVFAYPYGSPGNNGENVLSALGYKLGFTSYPGFTQCKARRMILLRTRIGNTDLKSYGL